jgi:3-oxoacyl-[acyl-carrier-protein] synthase III
MTTLKQATGPQYTRLMGFGAARGDLVVPNDDLVGPIDSSDEWIRQRTGLPYSRLRRRVRDRPRGRGRR